MGGHTVDFRRFRGRWHDIAGTRCWRRVTASSTLATISRQPRQWRCDLRHVSRHGSAHVERHALDMPEDAAARACGCQTRFASPNRCGGSISRRQYRRVIWATGYGVDFGWIDIPVCWIRVAIDSPPRHHRRARTVFAGPAMAFQN